MIILVDIGNSNIVITRYDGKTFSTPYRYNTDKTKSVDEYFVLLKDIIFDAKGIIISSVVPELNTIIKNVVIKYLNIEPLFVGPGIKTGIKIIVDNPKEVPNFEISEMFMKKVEQQILEAPEYYLWTHKRWKHKKQV